mgnify:CR=1 FL=1
MRKEEIRHDPIRENIVKSIQYLSDNNAVVLKVLVVVILIIGAFSYYNHLGNVKSESASHLAGRAQNTFINGNFDDTTTLVNVEIADFWTFWKSVFGHSENEKKIWRSFLL